MKFSCDACSAQYMIADEKVGERGVKVKCKKCEHMIIVRPVSDAGDGAGDAVGEGAAGDAAEAGVASDMGDAGFGGSSFGDSGFGASSFGDSSAGDSSSGEAGLGGADAGASGFDSSGLGQSSFGDGAAQEGGELAGMAGGFGDGMAAAGETDGAGGGEDEGGQIGGAFDSLFGGNAPAQSEGDGGGGVASGVHEEAEGGDGAGASEASAAQEWYVAIDDSQVGPISVLEIEQRWDAKDITEDSLAWKAGMDDWAPVGDIPELAYLVTERPQGNGDFSAGAGLGIGAASTGLSTDFSAGGGFAAAAGGADSSAAGSGTPMGAALGPVSFGGGDGAADVAWKPSAASALSSLVQDELTATEETKPEEPAAPIPEGMPALGGGLGGANVFGGPGNGGAAFAAPADGFAAPAAGFSLPAPPPPTSGGIRPIHIILTILLLAILGGLAVVILKVLPQLQTAPQAPAAQQVAGLQPGQDQGQPPGQAGQGTGQPTNAGAQQADGGGEKGQQQAEAKHDEDSAASKSRATSSSSSSSSKKSRRSTSSTSGRSKTTTKRDSKDDLDDVFNDGGRAPSKARLTQADVVDGVKKNAVKLLPCLKAARSKGEITPGTYKFILDWTIQPNGNVSGARLKGPANVMGTSMPACFAKAMRKWKFPASKQGAPVSNFPFGPINVN